MDQKEFLDGVLRTECNYVATHEWVTGHRVMTGRYEDGDDLRALHGAMGLVTEAGELLELFLTDVASIDASKVCEELGDLSYYLALTYDAFGLQPPTIRKAFPTRDARDGAGCICACAAQILDKYKRFLFYGRAFEQSKVEVYLQMISEYISNVADCFGLNMSQVRQVNNNKLRARYPDNFTAEHAYDRDLAKEEKILDAGVFKVGSFVRWSSQSGGYVKKKAGFITEVVPAGQMPKQHQPGWGQARDHISYIIKVPTPSPRNSSGHKLYWPVASILKSAV